MGLAEFFASVIDSLAWPVTILVLGLVIIVVFEEPLAELIRRVRKISHWGSVFELNEGVRRLQAGPLPEVRINRRDRFTIETDPRALAIEAWFQAESAGRKMLSEHGVHDEIGSPSEVIRRLRSENLIEQSSSDVLMRLLHLRNRSIHEPAFIADPEILEGFVETTKTMMQLIFGPTDS